MKNVILMSFLLFSVISFGQKKANVDIEWYFTGIMEGYDHDNKVEVYIDGALVKTSTVSKQSQKNKVSISTKRGKHTVKIVNFSLYENKWEEHTIANEFSVDARFEKDLILKKKNTISLIFDIDKEIVIESIK